MISKEIKAAMVEAAAIARWPTFQSFGKLYKRDVLQRMEKELTAAILELEKHGGKVTMPVATEGMCSNAANPKDYNNHFAAAWRVMHDAAPKWEDGK